MVWTVFVESALDPKGLLAFLFDGNARTLSSRFLVAIGLLKLRKTLAASVRALVVIDIKASDGKQTLSDKKFWLREQPG